MMRSRLSKKGKHLKQLAITVPDGVHKVKKFIAGKLAALPYTKGYIVDSKLIQEYFHGQELWFTVTVYITRKRWKRFLQACKTSASHAGEERRPKGNQGIILHAKAQPYAMWELVTKADKVEAKELITEYDVYRRNLKDLPTLVQDDWKSIKPTRYTKKSILNHLYLRAEEAEAEKEYRDRNIRKAMELMRSLFHLLPSTGGGIHYK